MQHSWKQENKTQQTPKHEQTTQKTNSTTSNKQQQHHTRFLFLFCVLLYLLRPLLTYKGTRGIIGNKKKQTNTNTET